MTRRWWPLGILGAALSSATAQQATLGDATMRVEFSPSDGHVRALRDWNGRKLAGADLDSIYIVVEVVPDLGLPT